MSTPDEDKDRERRELEMMEIKLQEYLKQLESDNKFLKHEHEEDIKIISNNLGCAIVGLLFVGAIAAIPEGIYKSAVDGARYLTRKFIDNPLKALTKKENEPQPDAGNLIGIIDPREEFLVVKHSHLNVADINLEKVIEQAVALERHTNGREVVVALEGDLVQLENGEPILTHQSWHQVSSEKYRKLRESKIALTLEEALAKVADYKQQNPHKRVVLCIELKPITTQQTIQKALSLIKQYGITDVYFDSFFGNKLDLIQQENTVRGTNYQRSFHLCGNVGNGKIWIPGYGPKQGYDVITVPKPVSIGKLDGPVIYGAVGSVEQLARLAEDPDTVGAYVRLREGSGLRGVATMLWNSMTNLKNLRHGGVDPELHAVPAYAGAAAR
ncbi:hypothetical protein HYU06_05715 [Candidatus Woesearchaeota archaeon]|nr:hypothetical protein [Candidatus Woesearchaeota archaeon]